MIEDTNIFIDQLLLKSYVKPKNIDVRTYENTFFYNENNNEKRIIDGSLIRNEEMLYNYIGEFDSLFLSGAFTNRIYQILVNKRNEINKLKIVVKDATNILIEPTNFKKLSKIGVKVEVLNQIDILFVTYNPYSPYGYSFNNYDFKAKLSEQLDFEIVNVVEDWSD